MKKEREREKKRKKSSTYAKFDVSVFDFSVFYHWRELPQVSFLLVATKVCLLLQNFCRDKNGDVFVAAKVVYIFASQALGSAAVTTYL